MDCKTKADWITRNGLQLMASICSYDSNFVTLFKIIALETPHSRTPAFIIIRRT
jgi:hypothetical protein